ncbi:hypothetical protein SRHO_G00092740 [Serrasalmus rhombeus]
MAFDCILNLLRVIKGSGCPEQTACPCWPFKKPRLLLPRVARCYRLCTCFWQLRIAPVSSRSASRRRQKKKTEGAETRAALSVWQPNSAPVLTPTRSQGKLAPHLKKRRERVPKHLPIYSPSPPV